MTTSESVPKNAAAWISTKGAQFEVRAAPYPHPAADEIVVRGRAVAINPLDWIVQVGAGIVFGWLKYPFILGSDVAGDVVEIGSAVTRFRVGEPRSRARRRQRSQTQQPRRRYVSELRGGARAHDLRDPPPTSRTNVRRLFRSVFRRQRAAYLKALRSRCKSRHRPPRSAGETVVIWGGSTSVGCNAIQLAAAAGYDVITTCSPKNFEYVRRLGAHAVFDYSEPAVVKHIVAAMKGKDACGRTRDRQGFGRRLYRSRAPLHRPQDGRARVVSGRFQPSDQPPLR